MTPDFQFGETVTVVRRTLSPTPDADGNDVYTETSTVYTNCPTWQTSSTENLQGGDLVTSDLVTLLPAGAVIDATDKVLVGGNAFEVAGLPWTPKSPFSGSSPGVVVELRRVTG